MKFSEYVFSLAIELTFKTSLPRSYMKMTIFSFKMKITSPALRQADQSAEKLLS